MTGPVGGGGWIMQVGHLIGDFPTFDVSTNPSHRPTTQCYPEYRLVGLGSGLVFRKLDPKMLETALTWVRPIFFGAAYFFNKNRWRENEGADSYPE